MIALLFFSVLLFCTEIIRTDYDIETEILSIFTRSLSTLLCYSTVSKGRCRGAFKNTDLTFNFTLTCCSPALTGNYYSDYQLFLYQTITEHREQGLTFHAIAEWMNKEGYLTVRGKRFRSAHVHSILKKRLAKEELPNREYPPVWSDFSMEVVDKTIVTKF